MWTIRESWYLWSKENLFRLSEFQVWADQIEISDDTDDTDDNDDNEVAGVKIVCNHGQDQSRQDFIFNV